MVRKVLVLSAITAVCVSGAGLATVAAQGDASIKGVYREAKRTGVKVAVFAGEGTARRRVASDYEFKSGDKFELDLETNQRSYVYVLNRTLSGDPNSLSAKGIERIRDDDRRDRPAATKYKLLYPMANDPKIADPNKAFKLAGFRMDDKPGVEKMFIVVSSKPIDITRYFDTSGEQRGGRRDDTAGDVLEQLNKDLAEWSQNAESLMAKGVERDPEGYGVVRDPAKPGMVEVTLRHFAKR